MSQQFFDELVMTYKINLSEQQRIAVTCIKGPCLLLAVPGGGKTTTLLSRIAFLIMVEEVAPEKILSITFSRASANDMKARYEALFSHMIKGRIHFSTIHSFAYGVVMSYVKSKNLNWVLIEGKYDSKWSKGKLLRQIYYTLNHDYISEGEYDILTNNISYVKNIMLSKEGIHSYKSEIKGFYEIYSQYEKIKHEEGLIDFDDMLSRCYLILMENNTILTYYQNRYDYIQVDEAQDTSKLQHEIIALVAQRHKNVFYVADDDQSIYGFRGASPQYLLNIRAVYNEATVIKMEQNFRSSNQIVEATNQFIKMNQHRYNKNIYTENETGLPVTICEANDREDQYKSVVKAISNESEHGDIAVLYRNNHSAIGMALKLSEQQIPFYLRDFKKKFFSHWVIVDILNILNFAQDVCNIHQFTSFYYKLRGYYISKQMLESMVNAGEEISVFRQIIENNNLAAYQEKNVEQLGEAFEILATLPPKDGIEYILTVMGYLEFLTDRTGGLRNTLDGYNNMIQVLKDMAKEVLDVKELEMKIEELEYIVERASKNDGKDVMTLTTVHSSKGLEWKQVYMIDLLNGIFPNNEVLKSMNSREIEEERRLFYVGMTRAKSKLTLYNTKNGITSIFLDELKDILEGKKEKKTLSNKGDKSTKRIYSVTEPVYACSQLEGSDTLYEPLVKGTEVEHINFGLGTVKYCNQKHIVICFGKKEKRMSYQYCLEKGLLTIK